MNSLTEHVKQSHSFIPIKDCTSRQIRLAKEIFGEYFTVQDKVEKDHDGYFIERSNFFAYTFKGFQLFVEFTVKDNCVKFE